MATPLTWIIDVPGATASMNSDAMRPAPEAPTWSPRRVTVMSTRPAAASIFGVNDAVVAPCRMNVPSWTLRTRTTDGSNVIVSDMVETRDALLIESGVRYGPPTTRNSRSVGVMMICAGVTVVPGAAGGETSGAFGSRGGVTGAVPGGTPPGGMVPPAGGIVPAGVGVTGGGWRP